ncbi:hypothetical protein GQ457_13G013700 [Hibiscus cannabinus]
MEMAIMRANIVEDHEATMARFLAGLNTEISNVVELQHYVELEDMVYMAIKVEKQQRRKTVNRGNTPSKPFSNSFNAPNNFRKPAPQAPLQNRERAETSKTKPHVDVGRGKQPMHQERSRDILCFKCLGRGHIVSQCPNRRTMLLLDSGEIESESEEDEPELPRETVQEEDDTLQSFETGDVLVIKRIIIDGGSCTNVASSIMVEKLGLKTTKHPNPYRLQWLNDGGEIKVNKQVLVPFTIGKYKDEVLCDVVAMGACHLLLGHPWQFDKGTLHDGLTNMYFFMHAGQKIMIRTPLTPSQVQEDQGRLRNNMEEAKEKKKIEREKEDSNAKVLSIPTSSSNFSNLQVSALFPKEVPKVASVGRLRTFMCLTEIQQPSLQRFDVPFSFATVFSPLPVKSSSCKLDFVSSDVFLIDCRGHDCCLEFCIIVCRFDNVQQALSVFMLCIIRKGTRTKASLAPSDSEFLVEVVESSGWYWCRLRRKRKFPAKRKSKLFPFVVDKERELEKLHLARLKLGDSYAARFSSTKLTHLQLAHFSSLRLHSAQLAQLKLNNPEVAEAHPVQERVSYEHVDSKRGVLHLSMHMHNMCGSLGMLWACGRDLGTSQACGWLNQPLSLHLFPPKWEIKEHDVRDLRLARLKIRSSYAARFSSTKCHTSAS